MIAPDIATIAGLDISTFAIDVVFLPIAETDARPWEHYRAPLRTKKETGDVAILRAAHRAPVALADLPWHLCRVAYIEEPLISWRTAGTVIKVARVQGAAIASIPQYVEVNQINVATWRKEFAGKGSFKSSEEAKRVIGARVSELLGPESIGLSNDAADAYGIAYSARAWHQRVENDPDELERRTIR
jgi:hypothetical protein